jgi:hypothetical protein
MQSVAIYLGSKKNTWNRNESRNFQILRDVLKGDYFSVNTISYYTREMTISEKWYCHYVKWLDTRLGLVTECTGIFRFITTINYSALANWQAPQITTKHTQSSRFAICTSRCLVTAPIAIYSSASVLTSLPAADCPTTPDHYSLSAYGHHCVPPAIAD